MLEVIYTETTTQETVDICCMVGEAQDKAISLCKFTSNQESTIALSLLRMIACDSRPRQAGHLRFHPQPVSFSRRLSLRSVLQQSLPIAQYMAAFLVPFPIEIPGK